MTATSAKSPKPVDAAFDIDNIERLVQARRSVRGFLPEPVPRELLERIFTVAQRAPSNCNVQPWRVWVVSGAARERVRDALLEGVKEGQGPNPDFNRTPRFEGVYRKHQVECAVELYSHMGIARDDKEGRLRAVLRNYELFDAPHVAFIGMDRAFGHSVALDVGMYMQTLMLLFTAHGIGCCPMGSLRQYPDIVRSVLPIPEEIGILSGICFGYEDPDVAANRTRTTRAELDENVVFVD